MLTSPGWFGIHCIPCVEVHTWCSQRLETVKYHLNEERKESEFSEMFIV